MSFDHTVLLIIDMQAGFDDPAMPKRWNSHADENGLKLLQAWRTTGRPIIHVRHDSIEPGSTLHPSHKGNAFRNGFKPEDGEALVSKSVNSAFIGTDLDLRLKRLKADLVVVFGITTDQCVSTTIRTGANLGWPMLLVEDACDCMDLPDRSGGTIPAATVHQVHVATLGFEFCSVKTTAETLAYYA